MAIIASYDWENDSWTQNHNNLPRQAWRQAVSEIAEKARATLPECNGRVDAAVKIVLADDVELLGDGSKARVASQANGAASYVVCNGECECKDFPKAPSGWCKHRIAAGIQKRAAILARQKVETQLDNARNGHSQEIQEPAKAGSVSLPEAPASCNCYVTLAGRKVQVTLRDSDEQRLLVRLETLLQRFPVDEEEAKQEQPEGWCSKHGMQMTQHRNAKGSWWSHKTAEGWCHGK